MKTVDILKQAENLTNDEEKLMLLAKFIGDNYDDLEVRDFIQLLIPLEDITERIYEHEQNLDTLSDYTTALTRLAEYYIKDEQTWKATHLLEKAEELLERKGTELLGGDHALLMQEGALRALQREERARQALSRTIPTT